MSLRQLQQKTAEAGELIPFPTLARVERGEVDPGLRRLHLLLKLYQIPPQLVSDLLDLEEYASTLPKSRDAQHLYDKGLELWKAGDMRGGMACLVAMQDLVKDDPAMLSFRQKAEVSFAIMASALGKFRLALSILERLLLQRLDSAVLVSVLVQAGYCWSRLGSSEMALALLARAESHIPKTNHKELAWVHHLRASALTALGEFNGADRATQRSLAAYRKVNDIYGESSALALRVGSLIKQRNGRAALTAAREARHHAEQHGFARLKCLRMIDEGRALILLHELDSALAVLRAALSEALTSSDRHAEFHIHYSLWKAHLALNQPEEAAFELGAAQHYVRFVSETSEEVEEIRALRTEPKSARAPRSADKRRAAR